MSDQTGTAGDDLLVGNEDSDTLNGEDGNDRLLGRGGVDHLYGGNGNDILDGGAGADQMDGGPGDDYYFVDDAGDVIAEAPGGGLDMVFTSVDYQLGDATHGSAVERLAAADPLATTPLRLWGNELDNEIWGNAGNNELYGYIGNDIFRGGPGDDLYLVSGSGKTVIEYADEGYDTVETQFPYALPDNVERLLYRGDAGASLFGNALDNTIIATLQFIRQTLIIDGGPGADTMQGSVGSDIFFVDDVGDVIQPDAGPPVSDAFPFHPDTVFSSIDFTLAAHEWRVIATYPSATLALQFTGNGLANELTGNDGANVLDGRAGADKLIGYGGADTFCFTTALGNGNVDQVIGFEPGTDEIALAASVFSGLQPGALDPLAFTIGTAAGDADDRVVYDADTGNLYFDPDGSGAASAQLFAILHEGLALSANDFIVI